MDNDIKTMLDAVREFQEEWNLTMEESRLVDVAFSVKNRPTIEAKSLPEQAC